MISVLQENKECWLCKTTNNLHDHHIFPAANRKHSERHGLKVWLCAEHHNLGNYCVHNNKEFSLELKKIAQSKFEETHTREEFMQIFGSNYL